MPDVNPQAGSGSSSPKLSRYTVGIDLSAEPKGTAVALVDWEGTRAEVVDLHIGVDDERLLAWLAHPSKAVGIDCPLGWPETFVDFLSAHSSGSAPRDINRSSGWRRDYVNRRTDLSVRERTGLVPLSVAADRISHAALRLAALVASQAAGAPVRRDGTGTIIEAYPAAALHMWGQSSRGYKGGKNRATLGESVDQLKAAAPWLILGDHEDLCRRSDDAFDAIICALVARAARCGATFPPETSEERRRASVEGWIHLPRGPLPSCPWTGLA